MYCIYVINIHKTPLHDVFHMLPLVSDEFDPFSTGRSYFSPTEGRKKQTAWEIQRKVVPKVAMIFCCWIFFAFRVLDHIPKFRFIDIYTVIIISISTNNSMLPVNKHQKNVSASCFGERKTCCGCKVDFFEASVCPFLQRERWQDWTCIPSELRRFQGPGWYTSPGYDPKRVDPKMSNVPKIPSPIQFMGMVYLPTCR